MTTVLAWIGGLVGIAVIIVAGCFGLRIFLTSLEP